MVSVEVSFFYYFNFSIGSQSLFSLQRVSTQTPSQICTHTDTAANTFALNDGPHGTKMVEHIQRDHDRKKAQQPTAAHVIVCMTVFYIGNF